MEFLFDRAREKRRRNNFPNGSRVQPLAASSITWLDSGQFMKNCARDKRQCGSAGALRIFCKKSRMGALRAVGKKSNSTSSTSSLAKSQRMHSYSIRREKARQLMTQLLICSLRSANESLFESLPAITAIFPKGPYLSR